MPGTVLNATEDKCPVPFPCQVTCIVFTLYVLYSSLFREKKQAKQNATTPRVKNKSAARLFKGRQPTGMETGK